MLKEFISLRVDNLFGINEKLSDDANSFSTTLTEFFQQPDSEGTKLFHHVSQFNSRRVTFLCKKQQEEHCSMELQKFLFNFIPNNLNTTSKELILDTEKPPVFIGAQAVPQQIALFMQAAKKVPINLISTTSDLTSKFSIPPKSNRSSYLTAASKAAQQITQSSTTQSEKTNSTCTDTQYSALNARIDAIMHSTKEKSIQLEQQQAKLGSQVTEMTEKIVDVASEFAALREQVITTNNTMQEMHATLTTLQIFQHYLMPLSKIYQLPFNLLSNKNQEGWKSINSNNIYQSFSSTHRTSTIR